MTTSLYAKEPKVPIPDNESEEEQRARLQKKARKMMYNENGVAYAPWVTRQIDEDVRIIIHFYSTICYYCLSLFDLILL